MEWCHNICIIRIHITSIQQIQVRIFCYILPVNQIMDRFVALHKFVQLPNRFVSYEDVAIRLCSFITSDWIGKWWPKRIISIGFRFIYINSRMKLMQSMWKLVTMCNMINDPRLRFLIFLLTHRPLPFLFWFSLLEWHTTVETITGL